MEFRAAPGYANPNQENLAMSDNVNSWPESWPNRPSDWDGRMEWAIWKICTGRSRILFCC